MTRCGFGRGVPMARTDEDGTESPPGSWRSAPGPSLFTVHTGRCFRRFPNVLRGALRAVTCQVVQQASGGISGDGRRAGSRWNAIRAIYPFRHEGLLVFDDETVGLPQEPFVSGAHGILDRLPPESSRPLMNPGWYRSGTIQIVLQAVPHYISRVTGLALFSSPFQPIPGRLARRCRSETSSITS